MNRNFYHLLFYLFCQQEINLLDGTLLFFKKIEKLLTFLILKNLARNVGKKTLTKFFNFAKIVITILRDIKSSIGDWEKLWTSCLEKRKWKT